MNDSDDKCLSEEEEKGNSGRTCIGITKELKFCRKSKSGRFFCHKHRRQPIHFSVAAFLAILFSYIAALIPVPWKATEIAPNKNVDFSVAFTTSFGFPWVGDPACWWLEHNGGIYPAHCTAYIRFQNLRPTSFMLHSYWVETEVDGAWTPVPLLPIQQPATVYFVNPPTNSPQQALKVTIAQHVFDPYIRAHNFAPGEAVYAWVFWGMPLKGIGNKLRFHAFDGAKESVQPITFISNDPRIHAPEFRAEDAVDISKFRRH